MTLPHQTTYLAKILVLIENNFCVCVCTGISCSTRSPSHVSSWLQRCVTSNKLIHSLEVSPVSFMRNIILLNLYESLRSEHCVCLGKRPFGVSLLYMGWDKHYGFQLYQSDPSGNYGGWKATCIGNNSAVSVSLCAV